ncbi:unnamed protein product [Trichogramma brassicae]|uniref:Uncharacterized protein n=1 Tax=Trichogramma brassicae TaxID=86971 RepID=A0A6H5ID28_9HYME|nr:unnamed protein product [Trichogramma brassicae]
MLYTHARKSNPLDFPNVNIKYEPSWNKTLPWNMRARMTLSPIRAIIHTEWRAPLTKELERQCYVRTRARRRVQREQRASIDAVYACTATAQMHTWRTRAHLISLVWFNTCLNLLKQFVARGLFIWTRVRSSVYNTPLQRVTLTVVQQRAIVGRQATARIYLCTKPMNVLGDFVCATRRAREILITYECILCTAFCNFDIFINASAYIIAATAGAYVTRVQKQNRNSSLSHMCAVADQLDQFLFFHIIFFIAYNVTWSFARRAHALGSRIRGDERRSAPNIEAYTSCTYIELLSLLQPVLSKRARAIVYTVYEKLRVWRLDGLFKFNKVNYTEKKLIIILESLQKSAMSKLIHITIYVNLNVLTDARNFQVTFDRIINYKPWSIDYTFNEGNELLFVRIVKLEVVHVVCATPRARIASFVRADLSRRVGDLQGYKSRNKCADTWLIARGSREDKGGGEKGVNVVFDEKLANIVNTSAARRAVIA